MSRLKIALFIATICGLCPLSGCGATALMGLTPSPYAGYGTGETYETGRRACQYGVCSVEVCSRMNNIPQCAWVPVGTLSLPVGGQMSCVDDICAHERCYNNGFCEWVPDAPTRVYTANGQTLVPGGYRTLAAEAHWRSATGPALHQ